MFSIWALDLERLTLIVSFLLQTIDLQKVMIRWGQKGLATCKNHMGNFQKSQRTLKLAASHKLSCPQLSFLFFSFFLVSFAKYTKLYLCAIYNNVIWSPTLKHWIIGLQPGLKLIYSKIINLWNIVVAREKKGQLNLKEISESEHVLA